MYIKILSEIESEVSINLSIKTLSSIGKSPSSQFSSSSDFKDSW